MNDTETNVSHLEEKIDSLVYNLYNIPKSMKEIIENKQNACTRLK